MKIVDKIKDRLGKFKTKILQNCGDTIIIINGKSVDPKDHKELEEMVDNMFNHHEHMVDRLFDSIDKNMDEIFKKARDIKSQNKPK